MIQDFLDSSVGAALVGVFGALSGVVLERRVRHWGEVRCVIGDEGWSVARSASRPDGSIVEERHLKVLFMNAKDLPVSVLDMRVVFYKENKPIEEWAWPDVKFVDEYGEKSPTSLVSLPPHAPVRRMISVAYLGRLG